MLTAALLVVAVERHAEAAYVPTANPEATPPSVTTEACLTAPPADVDPVLELPGCVKVVGELASPDDWGGAFYSLPEGIEVPSNATGLFVALTSTSPTALVITLEAGPIRYRRKLDGVRTFSAVIPLDEFKVEGGFPSAASFRPGRLSAVTVVLEGQFAQGSYEVRVEHLRFVGGGVPTRPDGGLDTPDSQPMGRGCADREPYCLIGADATVLSIDSRSCSTRGPLRGHAAVVLDLPGCVTLTVDLSNGGYGGIIYEGRDQQLTVAAEAARLVVEVDSTCDKPLHIKLEEVSPLNPGSRPLHFVFAHLLTRGVQMLDIPLARFFAGGRKYDYRPLKGISFLFEGVVAPGECTLSLERLALVEGSLTYAAGGGFPNSCPNSDAPPAALTATPAAAAPAAVRPDIGADPISIGASAVAMPRPKRDGTQSAVPDRSRGNTGRTATIVLLALSTFLGVFKRRARFGLLFLVAALLAAAGACSGGTHAQRPGIEGAPAPPPSAGVPPPAGLTPEIETGHMPVLLIDVGERAISQTEIQGHLKVLDAPPGPGDPRQVPARLTALIGVNLRGSSSTGFPQRSYAVEAQDETGRARKVGLLGMPAESDWALIACWNDKTCMRNALAHSMGRELGRWNPSSRFVELFVGVDYAGLYYLAEVPRRSPVRVAIPAPGADPTSGDITGGYIVRLEQRSRLDARSWRSPVAGPNGEGPLTYIHEYPNERNILMAQQAYIQGYLAGFEEMMKASSWPGEYQDWIDLTSWLDYLLVSELSKNVDAYRKSVYLVKQRDPAPGQRGKLALSPLWDFNHSLGNADYLDGWKISGFMWSVDALPFWLGRMLGNEGFQTALKCRWQELRRGGGAFDVARIKAKIAAWREHLTCTGAAFRHLTAWPLLRWGFHQDGNQVKVRGWWPNPCGKTQPDLPGDPCGAVDAPVPRFFDHEVAWLEAWVERRIEWLDGNLPGTCVNPSPKAIRSALNINQPTHGRLDPPATVAGGAWLPQRSRTEHRRPSHRRRRRCAGQGGVSFRAAKSVGGISGPRRKRDCGGKGAGTQRAASRA